jgi:outer membrane protein
MKKIVASVLILASGSAWADFVGVRASGGVFDYSVSGTIRDSAVTSDTIDLKNDMGLKDKKESSGFLYIEHPIPIIPNIRLGTTSLKLEGTGSLNATFNGVPFTTTTTTNLDLSHTDVGLYYEVIDTAFDLDLGVNFKMFKGNAYLTDGTNTTTQKIDATVPMFYGSVNIPIPITGFSIGADMSALSVNKSKISDLLIRVRYQTDYHFGVELGTRSMELKLENTDDQLYADIKIKGPYLNLFLYF